jgi:hypothetical protein
MCFANIIVAYGAYYKFRLARSLKSFSCINCLAEGLRDRAARSLSVVAQHPTWTRALCLVSLLCCFSPITANNKPSCKLSVKDKTFRLNEYFMHCVNSSEIGLAQSFCLEEPAGQFIRQRQLERKIASGEKSEALSFTICYTSHNSTKANCATHFFPKRLFLENIHAPWLMQSCTCAAFLRPRLKERAGNCTTQFGAAA